MAAVRIVYTLSRIKP